MKIPLLITLAAGLAMLAPTTHVQAAPKAKKDMAMKMSEMLKDKDARMMALHELMSTKERKMEIAKVLKADPEFREIFGNITTGGG